MTHRTLRDANALHDSSNNTLMFHRTARDAGLYGQIGEHEPGIATVIVLGLLGAAALGIFLLIVLGMTA